MNTSITSLLERLTSSQVLDLIFEEELKNKGYRFYYAIDFYDLHKYCFPFGLDGYPSTDSNQINFELETDVITGYDDLFSKMNDSFQILLPFDYRNELLGIRNTIVKRNYHSDKIFDYVPSFLEYLDNNESSWQKANRDFTLFVSIASGLISDGVKRLNSLLRNSNFKILESDFTEELNQLKPLFFANINIDDNLSSVLKDIFRKKAPFRESRNIDVLALSRIFNVNNYLNHELKNQKIAFLFLSSAKSTVEITDDLRQLGLQIESRPFNFHRTIEQLFISRLLSDLNFDQKIERLKELKKLIEYRDNQGKINLSIIEQPIVDVIVKTFHELREKYILVNFSRKKQFERIQKLFEQVPKEPNYNKVKRFFNNLELAASEFNSDEDNINEIRKLESSFGIERIFFLVLTSALSKLKKGSSIQISRGDDPIKGTGQHLPIVFKFSQEPYGNAFQKISTIYLNELALLKSNDVDADTIISELTSFVTSLITNDNNDSVSLEKRMVFCLYILVLPDASKKPNNDYASEFLIDLFNRELLPKHSDLYSDFIYALSWILRRSKKYSEALFYANLGIDHFKDDARFYHSRYLILACQDESFEIILKDIHRAQSLYPGLLEGQSNLVRSNILAALINSEVYISAKVIDQRGDYFTNPHKKLIELNVKIQNLKDLLGLSYLDYPEFLHTESYLRFIESNYEEKKEMKIEKLNESILILKKGYELTNKLVNYNSKEYENLQNRLEETSRKLGIVWS